MFVQVRIPTANADGTSPADIERVEVYGFTGAPEGNEDILKNGMLVASIPVRKPPENEPDPDEGRIGEGRQAGRSAGAAAAAAGLDGERVRPGRRGRRDRAARPAQFAEVVAEEEEGAEGAGRPW